MPGAPSGLLKVLGVAFGLAIIVGNTIGSGILRTPGDVAASLPSGPWFMGVWAAGGIYALFAAMTMAELAVMLPQSGGQYVYARRALGEYAGFVIGWTDWISCSAAVAAGAIALGELSRSLAPPLAPHGTAIAVTIVGIFTAVHWIGVRSGDVTQKVLSTVKVLALLAVAVACFAAPRATGSGDSAPHLPSGFLFLSAMVLAFQSVLYTYDGWNGIVYFGGEMRDPRQIPRSMAFGVLVVTAVYLSLNAAFLHSLGIAHLAQEKFAASAAALAVFGRTGERIVSTVMAVSILGNVSAILMQASRVPWAMAADGLLPRTTMLVNRGGTPHVSLALSGGVALVLILSGTFETVIALAAFFYVLQYAVSFSSLFVLRWREPDLPRPYHAWGYPGIPALVWLGAVAFIVGSLVGDRLNSIRALFVITASYPVYLLVKRLLRSGNVASRPE
ncbi:MAG TPA: APC family permease [Gemmatimonadaceae bacterium]|nr:APC family permease [Gemmatimonadaceae bacterium]